MLSRLHGEAQIINAPAGQAAQLMFTGEQNVIRAITL